MSERIPCPWCGSRDVPADHLGRCELATRARDEAVAHGQQYGVPGVTTADLWAHLGHVAAPPDMTRIVRQVLDLGWRPVDALASRDARLAAVEALHIRRECLVYDDEECADGTCEHPTGTCVVLSPAVCAHCADQTEPGGGWEHLIREAAYWPCATTRALRSDPDEASTDA